MPSSTSSSSGPAAPRWGRTWLAAALLALAGLGALETLGRMHGHVPSVVDDMPLWAVERAKVGRGGQQELVVLGASRIQLSFDPATFRAHYPAHASVQLALDGLHPLATLRDLASEEGFRGLALVDVTEPSFEPHSVEDQQPWVAWHRAQWQLDKAANRAMTTWLQSRFVFVNPVMDTLELANGFLHGRGWPQPNYIVTRADRSRLAYYALVPDLADHAAKRVARHRAYYAERPVPEPAAWLGHARVVEPWVERVQARGGRVVFFRPPASGGSRELDDRYYPRAAFWDRFAASTRAATLHFEDVPGLTDLPLPDTSHVDAADAPLFTRALLFALVGKGLLPPAAGLSAPVGAGGPAAAPLR